MEKHIFANGDMDSMKMALVVHGIDKAADAILSELAPQSPQVMKTYTLEELTDRYVGKRGTPEREKFEQAIRKETAQPPQVTDAEEFADWINNNWYEPKGYDGMWRVRVDDPEYDLPKPKINMFSTEDLYKKFKRKEGIF